MRRRGGRRAWGLGPVFGYEWTARSRRWQGFAARAVFLLAVLGVLAFVRGVSQAPTGEAPARMMARTASDFFKAMAVVQLAVVMLAAPAATAGALCQDRSNGSLVFLLTTDLSAREIVLGKLAARLIPALGLLLALLPVVAIGGLLGGVDLPSLAESTLVAASLAILGSTLALALSNVLGKTHEVLMVVFTLWAGWMLSVPMVDMAAGPLPVEAWALHPVGVLLTNFGNPANDTRMRIWFAAACLAVAAVLAAAAVRDLVPSFRRQMGRRPRVVEEGRAVRRFRHDVPWWPSPSLDRNPVLWREWHRDRPSRPARVVWLVYGGLATLTSAWVLAGQFHFPMGQRSVDEGSITLINAVQATFGLLLLSVTAATSLAEERARGSLDVLLATPLPTPAVVWGKWWGAYRKVLWLAVLPVTITVGTLWAKDTPTEVTPAAYLVPAAVLAHGAMLTSLGLALATWTRRLGPAVSATVIAFLVTTIGWILIGVQAQVGSGRAVFLLQGSIFFRAGELSRVLIDPWGVSDHLRGSIMMAGLAWTLIDALAAAALVGLTLLTFDRAMGRVPDRPRAPGRSQARVGELAEREVDGGLVA